MAYIGKQPVVGNFQVCDAISVVNGQAAYTMQVASANVEPENANHMLVSLNGVLQKPGSSFTISGATITFASNLATGDVIDFIILLGDTLNVGTPSDDSVGAAQIKNDLISGTTALASEPADTDEFLVSDAGTLKRIDYSLIKGGGITEADQWRVSTNINQGSNADMTSNWERNDSTGATYIGTGLSESSGIFSFPSTGIYLINYQMALDTDNGDTNAELLLRVTTNNSSYSTVAFGLTGNGSSADIRSTITNSYILDVTDTSNVKFKFQTDGFSSNTRVVGDSSTQISGFHIIRLGDT
jgi:hypothetical protein